MGYVLCVMGYVLRLMFYVLRVVGYVLCFARYVNVTSRSNTRARMVVTQHHLSPSAHIRYNQKAHSEIEKQWLNYIRMVFDDV